MTSVNDFFATYKLHREALKQANTLNKASVFDALAAAGITSVTVTFDGAGDSGQIEDITAKAKDAVHSLPNAAIEIQQTEWGSGKLDSSLCQLREAIETLCYDYLSEEQDGWENSDGAFGEFIFDVAKRSIELEFNARYSDFHTTSHTL